MISLKIKFVLKIRVYGCLESREGAGVDWQTQLLELRALS